MFEAGLTVFIKEEVLLSKIQKKAEEYSKPLQIIVINDKKNGEENFPNYSIKWHKGAPKSYYEATNKAIKTRKYQSILFLDNALYEDDFSFDKVMNLYEKNDESLLSYIRDYMKNSSFSKDDSFEQNICFRTIRYLSSKEMLKVSEKFDDNEKQKYINEIKEFASRLNFKYVLSSSLMKLPMKSYLWQLVNGDNPTISVKDNVLTFDKDKLANLTKKLFVIVDVISINQDTIIIEGTENISCIPGFSLIIKDENTEYTPALYPWKHRSQKGFVGDVVFVGSRFKFELPLKKSQFGFYITGGDCQIKTLSTFRAYSHIDETNSASYYAKNNYILKYDGEYFSLEKKSLFNSSKFETAYCENIDNQEVIELRKLYFKEKKKHKKPIWIVRDNEDRARDSGYELFKFFSTWKYKSNYEIVFVLDKNSPDYPKVSKLGKVIQPFSQEYKLYHLMAEKLIDTRGGISSSYIFNDNEKYFRNLCDWDYIWLVHGTISRDASTWTNKFVLNAKLYITSGYDEWKSISDTNNCYGYDDGEVVLTGTPRQDGLYNPELKEKMILFMPTWRRKFAGDLIPGTSEREYVDDFKNNSFCIFFNSLINDPRLLQCMKENGYKGEFYIHPSFIKQKDDMIGNEYISIGQSAADTTSLINRCAITVTDYSSVQFDSAYAHKPVVYTQYDVDTYDDGHTGGPGYFKFEEQGFGTVCYDLDSSVNAIINLIKSDCKMDDASLKNRDNFFKYSDKNNCQRVVNEILKIK